MKEAMAILVAAVAVATSATLPAHGATGSSGWFYVNTSGKSSLALVANNAGYGTVSGGKDDGGSVETYTLCVDVIDTKLNYQQTVFVTAEVGPRGTTAGAAFSAE